MAEDPREGHNGAIVWQLVTTGVVALLRNRESTKKGWIWNISVAIADRYHGMCVWRDRLSKESSYTIMNDTFHVFAVNDIKAITAFVFESAEHGRHFGETYKQWVRDKLRDDGFKGKIQSGPRFRRDMISRPCNFQHISGSAALAQIQQMEDAKQAVGKVISTIGQRRTVSLDNIDFEVGGKRNKRKELFHTEWPSRFEHMSIPIPEQEPSGMDLTYSHEPSATSASIPSVSVQATIGEQQLQSNGVHHNHNVESSSSLQYHQQYGDHHQQQQNGGYYTQQYYEEDHHHNNYQNQQLPYQQDQGAYQQDQGAYQNHEDQIDGHSQPNAAQGMTYEVEDIGYDYDDMNEPTEHFWRESIMEGTNWEDEMLKAWTLRSGDNEFTTSNYS